MKIEELFSKLIEDENLGKSKTASYTDGSNALVEEEVLRKLASEVSEEEYEKQAADAIYAGKVIAKVVVEKVAEFLEKRDKDFFQKIAVGSSDVISGWLREVKPNRGAADDQMRDEDKHGHDGKGRVSSFFGGNETVGASVKGGGIPEGGDGERITDLGGNTVKKLSAARAIRMIKRAMLEDDLARYQELEAKEQSGQLSPEEEQELHEIEQKLMALAQQQGAAGGAPAPGAGAEASPAPAGGPQAGGMGSDCDPGKVAAAKQILAKYFGK
jgi:hypothetical protein